MAEVVEAVQPLAELFGKADVEKDMLLYNKGLSDPDISVLHKYLRKNRHIEVLRLKRNYLSENGCPTLGAIVNDPTLVIVQLDISFNRIKDEGMKLLAEALRVNKRLKVLSVIAIGLGDNGAEYLGNALVENGSLIALQLQNNTFLKEGRVRGKLRLADGISQNRQLSVVTLGGTIAQRLNFARLLIARSGDPRVVLPYSSDKKMTKVVDYVLDFWSNAHKQAEPLTALPEESMNRILEDTKKFGSSKLGKLELELLEHVTIFLEAGNKKRRKLRGLKRSKIVVVGNSGAGKTSLINSVISQSSFLTVKNRVGPAPWMRVNDWNLDSMHCSIFNFGGEEEFNMVQSYFVAFSRAIVLVVVNLAEYEETDKCYYETVQMWINALHMHIPSGQYLIVATHVDQMDILEAIRKSEHIERMFQANEERVARELEALILEKNQEDRKSVFVRQWSMVDAESSSHQEVQNVFSPTVLAYDPEAAETISLAKEPRGTTVRKRRVQVTTELLEASLSQRPTLCTGEVMTVSCESGMEGLQSLRGVLLGMLQNPLEHGLSVDLPQSYMRLSEELEKHSKTNRVYMVEVNKLSHMFLKKTKLFSSQKKLDNALELLHDTGRILWIRSNERLHDIVFLSPQWVAQIVQSVINKSMFLPEGSGSVLDSISEDNELDKDTVEALKQAFRDEAVLDFRLLKRFPYWRYLSDLEFAKLLLLLKSFDLLCFLPRKFIGRSTVLSAFVPFYLRRDKEPPTVPHALQGLFKVARPGPEEASPGLEAFAGRHVQYRYLFMEYYPAGLMHHLLVRIFPFVIVDLQDTTRHVVKARSPDGTIVVIEEALTHGANGAQGTLTLTMIKEEDSNIWEMMNITVGVLEDFLKTLPGLHVSVFVAFMSVVNGEVVIPRPTLERLQVRIIESKRVPTSSLSLDYRGEELMLSWLLPEVFTRTSDDGGAEVPSPIHLTRKCVNSNLSSMLNNLHYQLSMFSADEKDERANILSTAFIDTLDSLLMLLCRQYGGASVRGWDKSFEFLKRKRVGGIVTIMRETHALKLLQKYVLTTHRKGNFLAKLSTAIGNTRQLLSTLNLTEA